MTFQDCCYECVKNTELVAEFNRLTGLKLGERRSLITKAIDDACGYDPDMMAMGEFVDFVYNYIWYPLIDEGLNNT